MAASSEKNSLLSSRLLRWALEVVGLLIAQVLLQLKYKSGLPVLWTFFLILLSIEIFRRTGLWKRALKAYATWGQQQKVVFFARTGFCVLVPVLLFTSGSYYLYMWLFPTPNLKWEVFYSKTTLSTGMRLNGIYWQVAYIETGLSIINDSDVPVHNLRLDIRTEDGLSIAKLKQIGSIPSCKSQPSIIVEFAAGDLGDGWTGSPPDPERFPDLAGSYVVNCLELGGRSAVHFSMPVIWDYDQKALDFGFGEHPTATPEIPRRYPQLLHISGTYETSGADGFERYNLDKKIIYEKDN